MVIIGLVHAWTTLHDFGFGLCQPLMELVYGLVAESISEFEVVLAMRS